VEKFYNKYTYFSLSLHRGERAGEPREPAIHIPTVQFQRNKLAEVLTRRGQKRYAPVYSKGIVCAGGVARPFGWLPPSLTIDPCPQIAPTLLGSETDQRRRRLSQSDEVEEEDEEEEMIDDIE
jgi:hypothetical protein